jgi:hypothetical protein
MGFELPLLLFGLSLGLAALLTPAVRWLALKNGSVAQPSSDRWHQKPTALMMGFGIPLDQWLRNELKAPLLDYLSPARLKREGRFDADIVARTVKEHFNGSGSHHHRLWALLMWQMWRERWMDG